MLIVVSQNVTLQFAWGKVAESVPSPSMLVPESTHMYPTNLSQGAETTRALTTVFAGLYRVLLEARSSRIPTKLTSFKTQF